MSLLPRAASATDVVMNNVNPDAAATSGERQPTLLTDADLETSPEKRRKVCFAICTLLLHTISMFSMLGESLYPRVPVRVSSVYVKVDERSENKNLRMTKSCTKSQPKATESNRKQSQATASNRKLSLRSLRSPCSPSAKESVFEHFCECRRNPIRTRDPGQPARGETH